MAENKKIIEGDCSTCKYALDDPFCCTKYDNPQYDCVLLMYQDSSGEWCEDENTHYRGYEVAPLKEYLERRKKHMETHKNDKPIEDSIAHLFSNY